MKIYMVSYRSRGPAAKAVEAETKEEAMEKFNAWKNKKENKDDFSDALGAYELEILK